jgi:hypothetical protein
MPETTTAANPRVQPSPSSSVYNPLEPSGGLTEKIEVSFVQAKTLM